MKDILWYLEDILQNLPKNTVLTNTILISCIQKANNQEAEYEKQLEDSIDWEH